MERIQYFDFLKETSFLVVKHLKDYLNSLKKEDELLYNNSLLFIEKRLKKPLQKPTLFRVVYNMCGGENFETVLPIATAFELLNISSYQSNSSFDNKLGALTKQDKDSQFICSMLSREYTTKLVLETSIETQIKCDILKSISKINHNIYRAQNLDLNVLSKNNYDLYISNESLFMDKYINRCYLGSGFFNGQICFWAAKLAGNEELASMLDTFGSYFGTGLHILNDLSDYIPNNRNDLINRDYQDQFSDFRNGRLTLPLYTAIKNIDIARKLSLEESFMNRNNLGQDIISEYVLTEDVFKFIHKTINDYYNLALNSLSSIESSYFKSMLEVMASVLKSNKFYFTINKIQNG